ncbi:MAG: 4Fe-4S binding protein [Pedobacter sp.]
MNIHNSPALWRRLSQGLFLTAFIVLFLHTDYQGQDQISGAVNLLFRFDPLIALAASLATRTFIILVVPAIFLFLSCIILGRWFCGWACPMGTLLDYARPLFSTKSRIMPAVLPKLRYGLLVIILVGALFGLPLIGFFDPFAILVRGLSMAFYPAFSMAIEKFFNLTYSHGPAWLNLFTEPVYQFLRATVLPFEQKVFTLALPAALMLCALFLLELFHRRFFCRNVCPLGALLALAARFAPWKINNRQPSCTACGQCSKICRAGAIDKRGQVNSERCILCLDCVTDCPKHQFEFSRNHGHAVTVAEGLSRRAFMGTTVSAIALPFLFAVRPLKRYPEPRLIRPPGALPEEEFLGRCVRCGECMQVCIGNALHPTIMEAGSEGIFTPRLIPRIGYCEYQCTLCGQVCPTGALKRLSQSKKQATVIGLASIDRNRCLPYAKGVPCMVCEEHCPTPEKAIRFREITVLNEMGQEVRVKQPYVVDRLCIGCGICENKCPLPGHSAIVVTSAGETRHQRPTGNNGYNL